MAEAETAELLAAARLEFMARPEVQEVFNIEKALVERLGMKGFPNRWGYHDGAQGPYVDHMWNAKRKAMAEQKSDYRAKWEQITSWFENLGLSERQLKTAYPDLPYIPSFVQPVKQRRRVTPIPDHIQQLIQLDRLLKKDKSD